MERNLHREHPNQEDHENLFSTTIASNRKQIDEANQKERRRSYISIELPNKAREIIVLEVLGQEIPGELRRIPHDEGVIPGAPRHDRVRRRVIHHIVSLAEERGRRIPIQSGVRPRHRLLLPDRRLPSTSPTAAAILHSAPNHYGARGWDRQLGFTEGVRSRIGAKTSLLKRGFALSSPVECDRRKRNVIGRIPEADLDPLQDIF